MLEAVGLTDGARQLVSLAGVQTGPGLGIQVCRSAMVRDSKQEKGASHERVGQKVKTSSLWSFLAHVDAWKG
jgi:hypothetical protein